MIIYTDSKGFIGEKEITPAHVYISQSDFGAILNAIKSGEIPTNSGKPFDVTFNGDINEYIAPWSKPNQNNFWK